jgi:TonB family protein
VPGVVRRKIRWAVGATFAAPHPSQTNDPMSSIPPQIEPEATRTEAEEPRTKPAPAADPLPGTLSSYMDGQPETLASDAPLSFVPHDADGRAVLPRVRIRTVRFGDLDEHELIQLLGSIEDERARARFRESVYISMFIWLIIVGLIFFGPKYLWHSPQLISPADAFKKEEMLTTLTNPVLPHHAAPAPKIDRGTLEKLRRMSPKPTPVPEAPKAAAVEPTPQPAAPAARATPPPPTPQPAQPLPSAPSPMPRSSAQPVPDTPLPQPTSRPNFNSGGSVSDSMRDLANNVARNRGGATNLPSGEGLRAHGGAMVGNGVDILSDTKGVDFQPYLARIMREIYEEWLPLIPEEARPPLNKQGWTAVRFTINPDGTIGGMHLDGSTHDVALDRAAWGSITGVNQFPPLPKQFTGPNLELRIHYLVNTTKE